MYRSVILGVAILLALVVSAANAAAPVPRQSPDFIIGGPAGASIRLSSLKGQVVLLEFLLVKCQRCANAAQTISKLQGELGPRGFKPIGVAFDNGVTASAVNSFAETLGVTYPVGSATSDQVDLYLGRAPTERFQVPQIVLIDRAGVVRAQSLPVGETNLQDEHFLRTAIEQLLGEQAPVN